MKHSLLKRMLACTAAAALCTAMLTGCGTVSSPSAQASGSAASSAAAPAATVTLKISMAEAPTDVKAQVVGEMVKEIEDKTNGELKFEIHYSNELGTLQDVTEQTKMGANLLTATSGDFYATYGAPDIAASSLCFVLTDNDQVNKLQDSELFQKWSDEIEKASGLKLLCMNWTAAPRNVLSTKPINSVADFKGLKIRVPGTAADAFFSALGASTMTMAFSDLYTNLQQGMVEACEASLSGLYSYSLQEVAKYCYLSGHNLAPAVWAMNAKIYNSLSPETQKVLTETLIKYGNEFSQKCADSNTDYMQKMKDAGVIFVEPSADDVKAMQQASKDAFAAFPDLTSGIADQISAIVSK